MQFQTAQAQLTFRLMQFHSLTHHRYSVARQDGAHVQDGIVGHVGQDVDDGDQGDGNSNRQRKIPGKTRCCVNSVLVGAGPSPFFLSLSPYSEF